jgi:hypothetical protein
MLPLAILLIIAILLMYSYLFVKLECAEGETIDRYCSNNKEVSSKACINGKWKATKLESCSPTQSCEFGMCMDTSCNTPETRYMCASDYTLIRQNCVNGIFQNRLLICGSDEYCSGKSCEKRPESCGDGYCTGDENIINCIRDCGSLSSWDTYYKSVAQNPDLQEYLYCDKDTEMDCESEVINSVILDIERTYKPSNPKEFIDAVTDWTYNWIYYDVRGNIGKSATELITERQENGYVVGNCAQYSVLELAILRRKGIPAVQTVGCVSNKGVKCSLYSALGLETRAGHLTGAVAGDEDYQPLAHSYLKVWSGEDWTLVDPTIKKSLSSCLGYFDIARGGTEEEPIQYYIRDYFAIQACRSF